ncbi:hypothetical protein JCM11491_003834 [Sporobolomyces phaffii]
MPRSRLAGPSPARQSQPDYFESLQALADYSSQPRLASPEPNRVPLGPGRGERQTDRARLVVCHDYKGGYTERDFERGYTFSFWHLCDTYIYFSHHRVSLPPAAVVRTAHRHGTRVLGTLIFEWDAGREDIIRLVDPGGTDATTHFDKLSFVYADALVDLACERGIDGWLVNVEVELGGLRDQAGERKGAREHARLLLAWLTYFTAKMHERVPNSEVMWYDAVTSEGKLSWQNALNERNLPFLRACDSIFLNYFWTPSEIAATLALVEQTTTVQKSQIHFGIDVFGRGSYGGGGFDTWRALEAVQQSDPTLSIALFAPGWTVESESLGHSLSSRDGHARWFEDDLYLWANGPATPSVPKELVRMRKVRQDQAGAHRARQLAAALHRDRRIPLAFRAPVEPLIFDLGAVPDLPGSFRSISHFGSSPRPAPTREGTFYTNFSSGSGHSFFICGTETPQSESGWTDIDYTYPFPNLLFTRAISGVKVSFTEEQASVWEGERAIKVDVDEVDASNTIDIVAVDYHIAGDTTYHATVIWKPLEHLETVDDSKLLDCDISPVPTLFGLDSTGRSAEQRMEETVSMTRNAGSGSRWRSTTSVVTRDPSTTTRITRFSLTQKRPASFLVGSISIVPAPQPDRGRLVIDSVSYGTATGFLEWSTSLSFPTRVSPDQGTRYSHLATTTVPSFVQYHVYRRRTKRGPEETEEYLGTTRERRFAVGRNVVSGYEVEVRGVEADGTAIECRTEIGI